MSRPKPNVEAAMEAARQVLDRCPDELTRDGSAAASLDLMRLQVRLDGWRDKIVKQALAGNWIAWRACCDEAALELRHGRPPKGALAEFAAERLSEAAGHPIDKKGSGLAWRDLRIALAVHAACEAGKLAATRSDAKKYKAGATDCGCSVVRTLLADKYGLHLSEDTIKDAWNKNSPLRS
jgi:hypothetical protein